MIGKVRELELEDNGTIQGQIYQSVKPCRSVSVVRWQHNQTVFVIILQNFFFLIIFVFLSKTVDMETLIISNELF